MRCCVPLCTNTSDNASTSERAGITFRRLPNEAILRTAWLRALDTQEHHLPDPAVVCSQHFSDDSFSNSKSCVRQIHSNCNASTVQAENSEVEAVVIKKEDCSVHENDCVSNEKYSNISIKIELEPLDEVVETLHRNTVTSSTTVAGHVIKTESCKSESITFGCTVCYQDFVQENAYNEHMSMHLQDTGSDAACDASQVCESHAAVSGDSLVLQNKTGSQRLSDEPPPASGCAPAIVAPLSTTPAENNENKVQATEICKYKAKHKRIHTGEKRYSCEMCDTKFARKSGLLRHMKTHTGVKPYSCEMCDYKFAVKSNLLRHMKTHVDGKPYSCEICSYTSTDKRNLLEHRTIHAGEKPYTCEICNNKFAHKNNLLQHKRIHTGEKPYSCEICNHKFTKKFGLLVHKRTHTGERPYSCEMCNYTCADKRNLLVHKRTHTVEKPFSCDICDSEFRQKSTLIEHKRTHTGEKPYSCKMCDYKFARKGSLLRHTRTHSGVKPYPCETCDHKFTRKNHLLNHMRIHSDAKPQD